MGYDLMLNVGALLCKHISCFLKIRNIDNYQSVYVK